MLKESLLECYKHQDDDTQMETLKQQRGNNDGFWAIVFFLVVSFGLGFITALLIFNH